MRNSVLGEIKNKWIAADNVLGDVIICNRMRLTVCQPFLTKENLCVLNGKNKALHGC